MSKTLFLLFVLSSVVGAWPVFKTGQTISYADYDDGYYQKGIDHNFSRDDVNGTVRDFAAALQWQDNGALSQATLSEAKTACENLDLDGKNDWRLPSTDELLSIVDIRYQSPAIDRTLFSYYDGYNTSTSVPLAGTSMVWFIYFNEGFFNRTSAGSTNNFRCVRELDNYEAVAHHYSRDAMDQSVYDRDTNLTWQDNDVSGTVWNAHTFSSSSADLNWTEAIGYCEDLNISGVDDWRLPNYNELHSVVDYTKIYPAMNSTFANVVNGAYWTSTSYARYSDKRAWSVIFNRGDSGWKDKSATYYVRCVRDGATELTSESSSINPALLIYLLN